MPLRKSFSEQNGSLKTRQRWQHKSRSRSAISQASATSNARPQPLERVADATKNKLNAFSFRPPAEAPEAAGERAKRELAVGENDSPASLPTAPMKHLSTPVNRLAWQDLIGDSSDAAGEDEDGSPQEKIGWDTKQKPMYGVSPVPRKRGSKRARSSSPMSSPAAAASRTVTPAVSVKQLSAALKSPRADPAIELWDRFSLSGSAATTPLGAANPALAQIMVSSSPQTPRFTGAGAAVGRGEAGLRRAISCGANWPKRRRVERSETAPAMSVAVEESPRYNSKSSMVNALLKSVTGELSRSKAVQTQLDVLKSPSPRKRCYNPADRLSGSPTRRLSPSKPSLPRESGPGCVSKDASAADTSSDYGDDDFDDDTLMNLDVNIDSALQQESRTLQPRTPVAKPTTTPNITAQSAEKVLDEFSDLDDDIFADAGDLLSQIDSAYDTGPRTSTSQAPGPASATSQEPVLDISAEDMYGDDFGGDFDFEAAEIVATQSAKQPNGPVPFVLAISKT
ncbi:hypothetical protein GGR55DRAFT_512159 [Xylaria sp. FL0064]|nr:hypothetical protein GGR55DRAFT_512159 [Xylaria sp. FL0064]